jgi:hypothetical protein
VCDSADDDALADVILGVQAVTQRRDDADWFVSRNATAFIVVVMVTSLDRLHAKRLLASVMPLIPHTGIIAASGAEISAAAAE